MGKIEQIAVVGRAVATRGRKPDLGALNPAFDLVCQLVERPADDEENMAGVDGAFARGARPALEIHQCLDLAGDVILALQIHIRLLHQLEQIDLHTAARNIAAHGGAGGGGDLVDLVDVDDAILGQFGVAVGSLHQIAHKVLDITTHVASFRELRRIRLHERHAY